MGMKSNQIYLRFLSLLHAIENSDELPPMDLESKRLLEVIAIRFNELKPLTVTDAMALNHIASPATLHRKLDQLREMGMIDTFFEGSNRRTKFMVPTATALRYFEKAEKALQSTLKAS
jgi:DNA-binding MarR family transcriptional regulator